MATLEHYRAFVATIEAGSLTAAAGRLGCSLQTVSRSLACLEEELGCELIRRTTRRLRPTPAGTLFYDRLKVALGAIDEARSEVLRGAAEIFGLLRVGASRHFAARFVVPAVTAFLAAYPETEVDLVLADERADLLAENLDVVIRIGDPLSMSLRGRPLVQLRRVLVATPAYLNRHGRPTVPADLAAHVCVVRTTGPERDLWPLTCQGRGIQVPVSGRLRCNEAAAANAAVVQGAGIGLAPLWQVRAELDQGLLELVLADYEPPPLPVQALWREHPTPTRIRAFVDLLQQRLAGERL